MKFLFMTFGVSSLALRYVNRRTLTTTSYMVRSSSKFAEAHQGSASIVVQCSQSDALERLGGLVAFVTDPQDVILLSGDIGAGKTCFSRGFVRYKIGDESLRVSSPSYLLDNTYEYYEDGDDTKRIIHHIDLYRLPQYCDLSILGIPDIFSSSICLIEWPTRMKSTPADYLAVKISIAQTSDIRTVELIPQGLKWVAKLQSLLKSMKLDEICLPDHSSEIIS